MDPSSARASARGEDLGEADEGLAEYAGGEIRERPGRIPVWLLVVYAVLAVWGAWYVIHAWGGLGPGLDY